MGAWGVRNFENDEAMDLVGEMDDDGWAYVLDAIEAVIIVPDGDVPDAYICSRALAAIEYIAAVKGNPATDLPDDASDWVASHENEPLEHHTIDDAVRAMNRITADSELKAQFEASGQLEAWRDVVADLIARIL